MHRCVVYTPQEPKRIVARTCPLLHHQESTPKSESQVKRVNTARPLRTIPKVAEHRTLACRRLDAHEHTTRKTTHR